MKRPKKFHFTRKTVVLALVIVVALTGGGVLAYQQTRPDNTSQTPVNPETSQNDDNINLDPPTEEEKQETEQHKDNLTKENEQPTGGSAKASITIVDASQYGQDIEVRVMVSGVYEEGGICKVTFTQGSQSLSKQSKGFKDATTTTCPPITVPRSEFPSAGDWNATVTYSSATASGASASKTVRVQ
jgi:cytoskeletal protein RodZ